MSYSLNGSYPAELPFRIVLSDGTTRTDPEQFTEEDIADAGYVAVEDKPEIDNTSQKALWNSETLSWDVSDYTEAELEAIQEASYSVKWQEVKYTRDKYIKNIMWRVERYESYVRMGLEPLDDITRLDTYIQQLRDITDQPDPFSIVWPNYNTESTE